MIYRYRKCRKQIRFRGKEQGCGDQVCFRYAEFEVSIRQPSGTGSEAVLYIKETWTGLVSSAYTGGMK